VILALGLGPYNYAAISDRLLCVKSYGCLVRSHFSAFLSSLLVIGSNSVATIIASMLVSPLMGPVVGTSFDMDACRLIWMLLRL
jgi:hypothetical protein